MNRAFAIACVALVAACATPASLTGSTEAELRARMGPPAGEYPNPDGSRTLAYNFGRLGTETYIADVAQDGAVRSVRSTRNDDTIMRIVPGLRREDVLRMLGPPNETMRFPRLGEESWEYYYIDTWGYRAFLYVNLDANGIVVSRLTRRIEGRTSTWH
jgi:hypothetical protein